ncbi:HD domain-containing phosphohydrolase [Thermodesulfobacteriota bacterium]
MSKKRVNAREAAQDIRAGMKDAELREKYTLSAREVQLLFVKLVQTGMLDQSELARGNRRISDLPESAPCSSQLTLQKAYLSPGSLCYTKTILAFMHDTSLQQSVADLVEEEQLGDFQAAVELPSHEELRLSYPDLVIVEMGPERLNFTETVDLTRNLGNSVPIIIVVDPAQREDGLKALEFGAYHYLEKPVDPRVLAASLHRAIEYSELIRFRSGHLKRMQEEIEEKTMEIVRAKDLLKGILDSSTLVSVVLTDLEQRVKFWNSGAENIFGFSAREMLGKKITGLYSPDSITQNTVEHLRKAVVVERGTTSAKIRQIAKDGKELSILLAVSPMFDAAGELLGILGVGVDVTEEERQRKEILDLVDQIERTQDVAIFSLAKLAESRDEETGVHLTRIQQYCKVLCDRLASRGQYETEMTVKFVDDLVRASVLHDIGKVSLPDSILLSKARFSPEEHQIMMKHTLAGGKALEEAVNKLGEKTLLSVGMEIAYYHHERWDGTGYPFALKGRGIPLSARIVAIVDVYDAVTTERRYKRAYSHDEAVAVIVEQKAKQFDPELVEAFMEVERKFREIRDSWLQE